MAFGIARYLWELCVQRYFFKFWINLGVELGGKPSNEYIDKSEQILRKRIALAGYRLAELLKKVYSAYQSKVTKELSFLNLFEEEDYAPR